MKLYTKSLIAAWAVAIGIGAATQANADVKEERLKACMEPTYLSIAGHTRSNHEFFDAMIDNAEKLTAGMIFCIEETEEDEMVKSIAVMMLSNPEVLKANIIKARANDPLVEFEGRYMDDPKASNEILEGKQ